jgi:predicted RNase H-like HicB family nuclease
MSNPEPPGPTPPPREGSNRMTFRVEVERESDGRWLAEVRELPGVMAYGPTAAEAGARAQALALRVVADRLDHGEAGPDLLSISFTAA